MCYCVDVVCFMANVVSECPGRESFTISELGRIRQRVEKAIEPENAMVEWTRGAFLSAMYYYADLFSKEDKIVSITPKARQILDEHFVNAEFNFSMSDRVKEKMQEAIREACNAPA